MQNAQIGAHAPVTSRWKSKLAAVGMMGLAGVTAGCTPTKMDPLPSGTYPLTHTLRVYGDGVGDVCTVDGGTHGKYQMEHYSGGNYRWTTPTGDTWTSASADGYVGPDFGKLEPPGQQTMKAITEGCRSTGMIQVPIQRSADVKLQIPVDLLNVPVSYHIEHLISPTGQNSQWVDSCKIDTLSGPWQVRHTRPYTLNNTSYSGSLYVTNPQGQQAISSPNGDQIDTLGSAAGFITGLCNLPLTTSGSVQIP